MRKTSLILASTAALALVAAAAATPALSQTRWTIEIGPPSYYQPYQSDNYGYYSRPYYTPDYGTYPNQRYNTYSYPTYPNYAPYGRYSDHGYFGR